MMGNNNGQLRMQQILRSIGRIILILFFTLSTTFVSAKKPSKPNILIIVADDMGYSDLGCYGGEIQTPTLDRLAVNGLRYTNFYNTGRCWSTRASLLTGYYAQAVRRDFASNFKGDLDKGTKRVSGPDGIRPRWAQLLPMYLKPLGYRSFTSGKWHIDGEALENGFDRSYLILKAGGFFTMKNHTENDVLLPSIAVNSGLYITIQTSDYAIKFLKEHAEKYADQPFFQYLAFNAPHFPLHALPEDIDVYKNRYKSGWNEIRQERYERMNEMGIIDCALSEPDLTTIPSWNLPEAELKERIGEKEVAYAYPWENLTEEQKEFQADKMAIHAAMIHRMDIEIGRVLEQIEAMGELDNTLIFFVSDNGASAEQIIREGGHDPQAPTGSAGTYLGIGPGWSMAANTPFRLHKSWNHEGGISTPLIVFWPDGIKDRGRIRTNTGHIIDFVPTILELAGGKMPETVAGLLVPPLHGKSIVPTFKKDVIVNRDYLWWNHTENRAFRVGDWKLVADHNAPWELYNMKTDRSETKNLAYLYPERVKELEQAWIKHAREFDELAQQDYPSKLGR